MRFPNKRINKLCLNRAVCKVQFFVFCPTSNSDQPVLCHNSNVLLINENIDDHKDLFCLDRNCGHGV